MRTSKVGSVSSSLVRHSAFHVLDHAWEMEDKDLTPGAGAPGAG